MLRSIVSGVEQAFQIGFINVPSHILAAKATGVESCWRFRTNCGRLNEVFKRLIEQSIAANNRVYFFNRFPVRNEFCNRRHIDAVDVWIAHRRCS